MSSEIFKREDVDRYDRQYDRLVNKGILKQGYDPRETHFINILHIDDEFSNLTIPSKYLYLLLYDKHCQYLKYLPMYVNVRKLERGENEWLGDTHYLGIYDNGVLNLYLESGYGHSILSLCWILLHEFRHLIQEREDTVKSCIYNKNLDMWKSSYGCDMNVLNHVLHEIMPAEVDANIFACELLGINYPNSKFAITEQTLKKISGYSETCGIGK